MSVLNEKNWNELDWTGWEPVDDHLEADPGWNLEDFLLTNVPRPEGTMVAHGWKNKADQIIEHWITEDGDDSYYRYVAEDFVACQGAVEAGEPNPGCQAIIPAHTSGRCYPSLEAALEGRV